MSPVCGPFIAQQRPTLRRPWGGRAGRQKEQCVFSWTGLVPCPSSAVYRLGHVDPLGHSRCPRAPFLCAKGGVRDPAAQGCCESPCEGHGQCSVGAGLPLHVSQRTRVCLTCTPPEGTGNSLCPGPASVLLLVFSLYSDHRPLVFVPCIPAAILVGTVAPSSSVRTRQLPGDNLLLLELHWVSVRPTYACGFSYFVCSGVKPRLDCLSI